MPEQRRNVTTKTDPTGNIDVFPTALSDAGRGCEHFQGLRPRNVHGKHLQSFNIAIGLRFDTL